MKNELTNLSSKLRDLHKELLLYQCQNAEQVDEKKYSPYDLLHLSIHDSRFGWLKKLSDLITRIDHKLHSDEEIEVLDVQLFHDQAHGLLSGDDPDFTGHYQIAFNLDPHLTMKQAEVLTALQKLQPWVKNMHEMHTENEENKFQNPL